MANGSAVRAMNPIHSGIPRIRGGRLGWEAIRMPMLELTTDRRKSGEARATMLS